MEVSVLYEQYNIYFCSAHEIQELKSFIHSYWKNNHSLAVSQLLMDWQYHCKENNSYNFVIARHNTSHEIHGILGFIPTRHFDSSMNGDNFWLSIWKIREDVKVAGLGLFLHEFLNINKKPQSICAIGLSAQVIPIYKLMGYKVGVLNHYYLVNRAIKDFKLIDHFDGKHDVIDAISNVEKKFHHYGKPDFYQLMQKDIPFTPSPQTPYKSPHYFFKRYCCHPIYTYHIYGVMDQHCLRGLLVIRRVSHDHNYALRVIDYFGNPVDLIGTLDAFQYLLKIHSAEYVDFYNTGIEEKIFNAIGFIKREKTSKIIIPNFFEPFEKKNIDLDFAYQSNAGENFVIFKGDSDQDRPNLIQQ